MLRRFLPETFLDNGDGLLIRIDKDIDRDGVVEPKQSKDCEMNDDDSGIRNCKDEYRSESKIDQAHDQHEPVDRPQLE